MHLRKKWKEDNGQKYKPPTDIEEENLAEYMFKKEGIAMTAEEVKRFLRGIGPLIIASLQTDNIRSVFEHLVDHFEKLIPEIGHDAAFKLLQDLALQRTIFAAQIKKFLSLKMLIFSNLSSLTCTSLQDLRSLCDSQVSSTH